MTNGITACVGSLGPDLAMNGSFAMRPSLQRGTLRQQLHRDGHRVADDVEHGRGALDVVAQLLDLFP